MTVATGGIDRIGRDRWHTTRTRVGDPPWNIMLPGPLGFPCFKITAENNIGSLINPVDMENFVTDNRSPTETNTHINFPDKRWTTSGKGRRNGLIKNTIVLIGSHKLRPIGSMNRGKKEEGKCGVSGVRCHGGMNMKTRIVENGT